MGKNRDVPNLGKFEVEGFARRVVNSKGLRDHTVPVIRVRRGRDKFVVMLQDSTSSTPDLDRLYSIGDRLEFWGLQLHNVILTSSGGIKRHAPLPPSGKLTTEDALAFLNA